MKCNLYNDIIVINKNCETHFNDTLGFLCEKRKFLWRKKE